MNCNEAQLTAHDRYRPVIVGPVIVGPVIVGPVIVGPIFVEPVIIGRVRLIGPELMDL